jgi:phosphoribosylformylglycinamidine synthase subunit PurL
VLLGADRGELGGSEYLKVVHNLVRGVPPALDLEAERALQTLLVTLADEGLARSAHDCSDGGLAVTVAESCFDTFGIGANVSIDAPPATGPSATSVATALFSESASRVIVSVAPEELTRVLERAAAAKVPARVIGQTGGNRLRIAVAGQMVIDQSVDEAERVWSNTIEHFFAKRVA